MSDKKIICSCNGLECEGVCRKLHLYRKRKTLKHCPAAEIKIERVENGS